MSDFSKIACLITESRRRQGITQSELARAIDCKQSAISMFERGHATALARPKVDAVLKRLGLPAVTTVETPSPVANAKCAGRRYCPVYDCPSNIPFCVQGLLLVKPNPHAQPTPGSKYCAFCGELLEDKCPDCSASVTEGACCTECGTAYISMPPRSTGDGAEGWAESQHARLRMLGLLPL